MNNASAFDFITLIMDGDQVAAALFPTKPLKQYLKLGTSAVTPDWNKVEEQPLIYPRMQSQNTGLRLTTISGSGKWKYNDVEIKFDSNGLSLDKKFKRETYKDGIVEVPALRIVGNLASADNTSADKLDFSAKVMVGVSELSVNPTLTISIEEVAGDPYDSYMVASNGGVIDNYTDSVICEATLRKGGAKVTDSVTYKFFADHPDGRKEIKADAGTPNKKTFTKDDIDSSLVVMCEMSVSGVLVSSAVIQLFDETDPIIINTRPSGPLAFSIGGKITFNPIVVRRDKGIPLTGYKFSYRLHNMQGVETSRKEGASITITSDDLIANGGGLALHTDVKKI